MNTKTVTLTLSGARPNNLPDMVIDEVRTITIAAGPVADGGTVTAASITADPDNLTIGAASISSPNATVLITAAESGCYTLTVSATVGSEIFKGLVDLNVIDPDADSSTDYVSA